MLEGYQTAGNALRVLKKCVRECPLYVNTTAEVVRCCTEDSCNEKFVSLPGMHFFCCGRCKCSLYRYYIGNFIIMIHIPRMEYDAKSVYL